MLIPFFTLIMLTLASVSHAEVSTPLRLSAEMKVGAAPIQNIKMGSSNGNRPFFTARILSDPSYQISLKTKLDLKTWSIPIHNLNTLYASPPLYPAAAYVLTVSAL